jgi:hypothetical protein
MHEMRKGNLVGLVPGVSIPAGQNWGMSVVQCPGQEIAIANEDIP